MVTGREKHHLRIPVSTNVRAVDDYYAIVRDSVPWALLSPGSKIVDIGCGSGNVSTSLAREHPSLQFVVQGLSPI